MEQSKPVPPSAGSPDTVVGDENDFRKFKRSLPRSQRTHSISLYAEMLKHIKSERTKR